MKLTRVKIYKKYDYSANVSDTGETADILTESNIFRPVIIIAFLTVVAGIFGLVSQEFPALSWASIAYGVINLILTTYETVINSGSITNEQTPTNQ